MAPICDDSQCFATPTAGYDMHVGRKRPHLTADRPRKTRAVLKSYWHPEFWSSFINKHSSFRQTKAVVHCQIQQQTITCCNAELSLSNHRYIATWTLDGISGNIWKVIIWGPLFVLENMGFKFWVYTAQHEITPLFLLMFDIKHKKNTFFE